MPLHISNVALVDANGKASRVGIKVEDGKSLFPGRRGACSPLGSVAIGTAVAAPGAVLLRLALVKSERIPHSLGIARRMPFAKLPARPLPNRIVADFGFDLRVAHTGVVVPGGVIPAYMVEAEPVVMVELKARLRRAILAASRAARMVTSTYRRLCRGRENGINRLTPHDAQYGWHARA